MHNISITDTKLYVLVVTALVQDNKNCIKQLKSGFKITINWSKYKSKILAERQVQYLYYLINPREDEAQRTSYKQYYIPTVEIKNCNVFIDRKKRY